MTPEERLEDVRRRLRECFRIRAEYQTVVDELLDEQQSIVAELRRSDTSSGQQP
jgi:DNA repair ATPase RecN